MDTNGDVKEFAAIAVVEEKANGDIGEPRAGLVILRNRLFFRRAGYVLLRVEAIPGAADVLVGR